MSTQFPWRRLFRLALLNGLVPERVWHMTAGELHMVMQRQTQIPVSPDVLAALTRAAQNGEINAPDMSETEPTPNRNYM